MPKKTLSLKEVEELYIQALAKGEIEVAQCVFREHFENTLEKRYGEKVPEDMPQFFDLMLLAVETTAVHWHTEGKIRDKSTPSNYTKGILSNGMNALLRKRTSGKNQYREQELKQEYALMEEPEVDTNTTEEFENHKTRIWGKALKRITPECLELMTKIHAEEMNATSWLLRDRRVQTRRAPFGQLKGIVNWLTSIKSAIQAEKMGLELVFEAYSNSEYNGIADYNKVYDWLRQMASRCTRALVAEYTKHWKNNPQP